MPKKEIALSSLGLNFFNSIEYNAQSSAANSIHKSPLLKFMFIIVLIFSFDNITNTPVSESNMPMTCIFLMFSLKNTDAIKSIKMGISELSKVAFVAEVYWRLTYAKELKAVMPNSARIVMLKKFCFIIL